MFIIKQGKAFLVNEKQAIEIKFNDDLSYELLENTIEIDDNIKKYSLDEVMAKLNVKYEIKTRLKREALISMGDKKLLEEKKELEKTLTEKETEIKKLIEEIALLKKTVKGKETETEPLKKQ